VELFSDDRCLRHAVRFGYPEVPERLSGIVAGLERAGRRVRREGPHPAAAAAVERLHPAAYVERFRRACERGDGLLDSADNPLAGAATFEAAWAAIDAVLHAADAAAAGDASFALVRPPGHHAERELAMGFCFFGNAAVAAEHLRREHGCARVAIFDFDVHHGNGTQHLFEERGDVFYASTHQYPFYPGTGAAHERGRGAGEGATLNVPLAAGCGDDEYAAAIEELVLPALEAFAPAALVVSAGFDAWRGDPLGGMRVSADGFRAWSRRLGELARRRCGGRLLAVLEGGYDLGALPELAAAAVAGFEEGLATVAHATAPR
jgi:acetoin utilization deacetylase AcuC-like enzyme